MLTITFKIKSEKELDTLTDIRLKNYIKAESDRYHIEKMNYEDSYGYENINISEDVIKKLKEWSNYIVFLKKYYKEKTNANN